jgi:Carboxypeptidase regulatory-like domain
MRDRVLFATCVELVHLRGVRSHLVIAALAGFAGLGAGRIGGREPAPARVARCTPVPAPAVGDRAPLTARAEPTLPPPHPDPDVETDPDGEDVADVLAQAEQRAEVRAREHNAIVGTVTSTTTGESLAGVTVVVTSPALDASQTTITDGAGGYAVTGLPAGTYEVVFYFNDARDVHANTWVTSLDPTRLDTHLDPDGPTEGLMFGE